MDWEVGSQDVRAKEADVYLGWEEANEGVGGEQEMGEEVEGEQG